MAGKKYHLEIDREPYFCTFQYETNNLLLIFIHHKKRQPETEIKVL
jgi:hypothetical protein